MTSSWCLMTSPSVSRPCESLRTEKQCAALTVREVHCLVPCKMAHTWNDAAPRRPNGCSNRCLGRGVASTDATALQLSPEVLRRRHNCPGGGARVQALVLPAWRSTAVVVLRPSLPMQTVVDRATGGPSAADSRHYGPLPPSHITSSRQYVAFTVIARPATTCNDGWLVVNAEHGVVPVRLCTDCARSHTDRDARLTDERKPETLIPLGMSMDSS